MRPGAAMRFFALLGILATFTGHAYAQIHWTQEKVQLFPFMAYLHVRFELFLTKSVHECRSEDLC